MIKKMKRLLFMLIVGLIIGLITPFIWFLYLMAGDKKLEKDVQNVLVGSFERWLYKGEERFPNTMPPRVRYDDPRTRRN